MSLCLFVFNWNLLQENEFTVTYGHMCCITTKPGESYTMRALSRIKRLYLRFVRSMRTLSKWLHPSMILGRKCGAQMFMGPNSSGPKMTSYRQMASDTYILKFSPVTEFRRHNSEFEETIFVLLIFSATVRCKKRSPKGRSEL